MICVFKFWVSLFKKFSHQTFLRHHSDPFYTPEPDLCHEILGHMPMLADKNFADYSQLLGLASLGASEEDVKKIASVKLYQIYNYTISLALQKY